MSPYFPMLDRGFFPLQLHPQPIQGEGESPLQQQLARPSWQVQSAPHEPAELNSESTLMALFSATLVIVHTPPPMQRPIPVSEKTPQKLEPESRVPSPIDGSSHLPQKEEASSPLR